MAFLNPGDMVASTSFAGEIFMWIVVTVIPSAAGAEWYTITFIKPIKYKSTGTNCLGTMYTVDVCKGDVVSEDIVRFSRAETK